MSCIEILIARLRSILVLCGKPRKVLFEHEAKPSVYIPCTARIANDILVVNGSCNVRIVNNVLTTSGSCSAAIENNILYTIGGAKE